jgi:hypothetical protein
MATTTNYGWVTPDDTALVKDGAAAIRTLGSSVDTTTKALNPSTTLGDIEYRSSTANTNTRLGIGTTGQVLTVSGGVPAWSTISAGGMTLIQETVASANSAIDFTSISGSYKQLLLVWCGIFQSTSGSEFSIRLNSNSGSMYANKGIRWEDATPSLIEQFDSTISTAGANPPIGNGNTSSDLSEVSTGTLLIDNYASTTKAKEYSCSWGYRRIGVGSRSGNLNGIFNSTSAITSLNIFRINGSATLSNATDTSIRLYGIS